VPRLCAETGKGKQNALKGREVSCLPSRAGVLKPSPPPPQVWKMWDGKAWLSQPLITCIERTEAQLQQALTPHPAILLDCHATLSSQAASDLGWCAPYPLPYKKIEKTARLAHTGSHAPPGHPARLPRHALVTSSLGFGMVRSLPSPIQEERRQLG
jgi:hypothetical protein